MFCPVDYVPFVDVFRRWQNERHEADLRYTSEIWSQRADAEGNDRHAFFAFAPADISEEDLFTALADEVFMTSPQGQVMKLDYQTLSDAAAAWDLNIDDFDEASEDVADLTPLDGSFIAAFKLCTVPWETLARLLEAARASNPAHTIWSVAEDRGLGRRHLIVPPFFERIGYFIDLRAFDLAEQLGLTDSPRALEVIRHLRSFEGWALCVPKDALKPQAWAALVRTAGTFPRRWQTSPGRPRRQEEALAAYHHAFPGGHESKTLKEATRQLNGFLDSPVSPKTLRRALDAEKNGKITEQFGSKSETKI